MLQKLFLTSHVAEYHIREDGVVLKYEGGTESIQPLSPTDSGYLKCKLVTEPGKFKMYRPHQLVARAFIPNPLGLPMVNHKDGIKANCHKDNLEWSDNRGNLIHAYNNGLKGSKTSRFYGVSWDSGRGKWRADVNPGDGNKALGRHAIEKDAARAVNAFIVERGINTPLNIL